MEPQAAADSAGVASLAPMITLDIPGAPTSAVIMTGLFIWGLQPGPVCSFNIPIRLRPASRASTSGIS